MKIAIDIDAEGVYCGKCFRCDMKRHKPQREYQCRLFINEWGDYVELEYEDMYKVKRCQQCLDAEIKDEA